MSPLPLELAVFTAHRGYAWSNPGGATSEAVRDELYRLATRERPEFPDGEHVESGLVATHGVAAVYAVRRVANWDSEGRDADYGAFAFFPAAAAGRVDVAELLENDFFTAPQREPPVALDFCGSPAAAFPLLAVGRLLCQHRFDGLDPHVAGSLLAAYQDKCPEWAFRLVADFGLMQVTCAPWRATGA